MNSNNLYGLFTDNGKWALETNLRRLKQRAKTQGVHGEIRIMRNAANSDSYDAPTFRVLSDFLERI